MNKPKSYNLDTLHRVLKNFVLFELQQVYTIKILHFWSFYFMRIIIIKKKKWSSIWRTQSEVLKNMVAEVLWLYHGKLKVRPALSTLFNVHLNSLLVNSTESTSPLHQPVSLIFVSLFYALSPLSQLCFHLEGLGESSCREERRHHCPSTPAPESRGALLEPDKSERTESTSVGPTQTHETTESNHIYVWVCFYKF